MPRVTRWRSSGLALFQCSLRLVALFGAEPRFDQDGESPVVVRNQICFKDVSRERKCPP